VVALDDPYHRLVGDQKGRLRAIAELLDDPLHFEAAVALLALTDPVVRDAAGRIAGIPHADRYTGPLARYVLLPFALPPDGRFNDSDTGAWYGADTLTAAIAEVRFHLGRWLTGTPPTTIGRTLARAIVQGRAHDARRGQPGVAAEIYDPDPAQYGSARAYARSVRGPGADALLYTSVRAAPANCIAVWIPRAIADLTLVGRMLCRWDGNRIVEVYREVE
jgi:hypothetical protein